jgi:molybdopterin synthase catalytic subunit
VNPPAGDSWLDLIAGPLPVEPAVAWATRPQCGAVVTFSGTARDHSEGRPGVHALHYEAYESAARTRLGELVDEMRRRWPEVVAVALLHRLGDVPIGEAAVVVVVSSAHRDAAFDAARFGIDALKRTVPIWKRERWDGGESWGLEPQHLVTPADVASVDGDVEVVA